MMREFSVPVGKTSSDRSRYVKSAAGLGVGGGKNAVAVLNFTESRGHTF